MTLRSAAFRLLLCAACLLLAGGCSMVRIGYNHLDTIAAWMADDYFDLDAQQRDEFSRRFARLQDWHRREQLEDYSRFLEEIQSRIKRGLRAPDVLWVMDSAKQRYARIAARSAADAADLLATLTPAQIDVLKRQLDRKNRKFRDEHRSEDGEAARHKAVEKRMLSLLQDWVGRLSDDQETRGIAMVKKLPLVDKLRYGERLRRQREFLALLELRGGERSVFAQRIHDWLVYWEAGRSTATVTSYTAAWNSYAQFYETVDRMLTPAQRDHLLHELQDYIDNFRELAARRPAAATAR